MAEVKKGSEPQPGLRGFAETRSVHVTGAPFGARRTVTFGHVTVTGPELTPEQRARNAAESTAALSRLMPHLVVPGVRIKRKPGVPLIYANKHRPGTVIREVDGRKDVGLLRGDGTFELLEAGAAE
jgi:hypothetical protein